MSRKRDRARMRGRNRGLTPAQQQLAKAKRKAAVATELAEDRDQMLTHNGYVYVKRYDPQRGWEIAEFTMASWKRHEAWEANADQRESIVKIRQMGEAPAREG